MYKLYFYFFVFVLLISVKANALTVVSGNQFDVLTASTIQTHTAGNVTDTFYLSFYQSASIQCAWADVGGTTPEYKLQFSNDNSNWDDVSGVTTVTTGSSGSDTWLMEPVSVRYSRVNVSTASTTGTLDCIAVGHGEK